MKLINLLPKPRQEQLRYESVYRSLVTAVWLSVLSFVAVLATQLAAKVYLDVQAKTTQDTVQMLRVQVSKNQASDLNKQITSYNNYITDYKKLSAAEPKLSKLILAFAPLPPDGVQIITLNFDIKKQQITITGHSPTRDLVIALYNNILADSQQFYGIDYPLENVATPDNNTFHFSFYVKPQVFQ
ncbi:MAG: hypothetical protein KGJ93_02095 [Patescibacteria group bacterium]|nr:hypothetical protein [Patescibacteria group bacterium]